MDKSTEKPNDDRVEKLERYLDQVCRGIAGPRALRQHVRQELREHLKDAIADHVAAGLTEEQAVDRALEDFGGPEVVRAELEATHGHRVMGVIIDKAMQWQERTVKAKWFWSAWAHLALGLVIAGEVTLLMMGIICIVPLLEVFAKQGMLGDAFTYVRPCFIRLLDLIRFLDLHGIWIIAAFAVSWALFEWRVRSERKPFIRLAAMGTLAVLLMAAVTLFAIVLVAPLSDGVGYVSRRPPEPVVREQLAAIDASVADTERGLRENDLAAIRLHARQTAEQIQNLSRLGAAVPAMISSQEPVRARELGEHLISAQLAMWDVVIAAQGENHEQMASAMRRFRAAYEPVKLSATTRPAQ